MVRFLDNTFFLLLLGACLFSACGDALPSAESVIKAINGDSIRTQNGISLSADYTTLYLSLPIEEKDGRDRPRVRIYQRKWNGRAYGAPELVSFNSNYTDYHPVMAPDGQRIYFNSTRPKPGNTEELGTVDIWYVEKEDDHWSPARYLPILNTSGEDSYPAVDESGRLFFNSDRGAGDGAMDLWMAAPNENAFKAPRIVNELNTSDSENDLTISPDGQTLIFNRYTAEFRSMDLYQSKWDGGRWSEPILLEKINEPNIWELTPTIGPKGRLFLYERNGVIRAMELAEIN
jgi:Tol biopolymer transport system component